MDNKPEQGFKLPPPSDAPAAPPPAGAPATDHAAPAPGPAAPGTAAPESTAGTLEPPPSVSSVDTHSRDLAIASGLVVVLLIAFFFAKNAYANMLVGRKVAPRSANAAGWWLFIALAVLALAIVFGAVDANRFMVNIYLIPLAAVEILSIVLLVLSSRR